jgi:hypothetical protein
MSMVQASFESLYITCRKAMSSSTRIIVVLSINVLPHDISTKEKMMSVFPFQWLEVSPTQTAFSPKRMFGNNLLGIGFQDIGQEE